MTFVALWAAMIVMWFIGVSMGVLMTAVWFTYVRGSESPIKTVHEEPMPWMEDRR